jgi:tripartite-type tricarboxylate transporter receptor subunit TctC
MIFRSRRLTLATLATLLGLGAGLPALADPQYPNKPIRLVIGYAPGGSVDMAGRILADMLSSKLGATVVVDNQPGAAGTIAAQRVVNSVPDGYTLLAGSSNELAGTGQVNPAQKYDPLKDLTPVGLVGTAPVVLVASPKHNVKNLDQFLALVKSKPGRFSYGSSGVGSTLHFAGELIKQRAGLFMTHIPYRGTAPLISDLVGGAIDFAIMSPTSAAPFIENNRLIGLGVTSAQRFPTLPQIPALGEHPAFKGYELSGWFALAGPRGLPEPVAQRLRAAMQAGLQEPGFRQRLEQGGSFPSSGKEDVLKVMRADIALYGELVKFANIRD